MSRFRIPTWPRVVRKLTTASYWSAKTYGLMRLEYESRHRASSAPILVFSMGKVGTTTVARSLREALPAVPIHHVHTLSPHRMAQEEAVYRKHFPRLRTIHGHLLSSLFLHRQLARVRHSGSRWKVVTMVRDPVARNISAFFQTLNLHGADLGFADRILAGGDETLLRDMTQFFVHEWGRHLSMAEWFDREIKGVLGIDVTSDAFSTTAGQRVYRGDFADLLLMRLEDLDPCATVALSDFLGLAAPVTLVRKQEADKKYYGALYGQFKAALVMPDELLDAVYGTGVVRTLYHADEIARFRARWSAKREPDEK